MGRSSSRRQPQRGPVLGRQPRPGRRPGRRPQPPGRRRPPGRPGRHGRSPGPWTPPAEPASPARPHPTTRPRQATRRDRPHHPPDRTQPRQPRQRQAARDHVTQLRQHGWTYRSIAAATALSPDTVHALATGRRTAQPATATAVLKLTRRILSGSRLDAGGTRLRLRALHVMGHGSARIARAARRPPPDHPPARPRRRPHRQPPAAQRHHRRLRRLVGQTRPHPHPLRTRRGHRRPQTRHRRQLVRRRRPRRRPARPTRLPAPAGLDARHRHRHRPRHPPARTPAEEEPRMTGDDRLTWDFITDVLDVLERHGYHRADNEHTGQAIGLIRDVARIYEGTLDAPRGGYVVVPSSQPSSTHSRRPARRHRPSRPGQDPAGRAGRRRRIQARPGRNVRRLRRPVLHHLPMAPADRRCLRPAGRANDPGRRGLRRPATRARPRAPGTDGPHAAADREAGQ